MTDEEFKKLYTDCYHCDVRWGDLDAMQHMNNTVFFRFFESSRMAFWTRLEQAIQGQYPKEWGPILAATSCQFKRPVYYPDNVITGTKVIKMEEERFVMEHAIWSEREQNIVAKGDAVVVSYDYNTKKKIPVPKVWKQFMGF